MDIFSLFVFNNLKEFSTAFRPPLFPMTLATEDGLTILISIV